MFCFSKEEKALNHDSRLKLHMVKGAGHFMAVRKVYERQSEGKERGGRKGRTQRGGIEQI